MIQFFVRIRRFIHDVWIYSNSNRYANYLRGKGCAVGKNFRILANGPMRNIIIDVSRPSLVTIGDNVAINKNFALFTHDFVCGVFIRRFQDFVPSSGKVTIGNNVRFGANCMVLKNVEIGDNCFIAAGSIVTKDIPSNSIAAGIPCKVICSLNDYYERRKRECVEEAFFYARSIEKRFGRKPIPADFGEEFPFFVDKSNINDYPEIPIRKQLQEAYPTWINEHKRMFNTFEDFLKAAGVQI